MAKSGLEYWRSLDELAETSEFRHWVESEFPSACEETPDPVSRRHFVKIMSASFLMAGVGLTGCRRPESKILPFSRMPEDYTHGSAQFFATAMPTRSSAVPLLIKSVDGRPIKAEGNPDHPGGTRGTDIFAQASLLNLFDPDRSQHILADGEKALRVSALDKLKVLAGTLKAEQGAGLAVLRESSTSPSRHRVESSLREIWPQAKWYLDDTVDDSAVDRAASSLYGSSLVTDYDFSKAKVVLSLDNDFMMIEPDSFRHIKGYASARRVLNPEDSMNRLYTVESGMTVTGSNADHRLKIAAGELAGIASRLASYIADKTVGVRGNTEASGFLEKSKSAGNSAENHSEWIEGCADDLLDNAGACLVVAGNHQPESVHVLVHAINEALGNAGKTVFYREAPENKSGNLSDLVSSLKRDEVKTLVILGANPAYTAPVDLEWTKVQESAESIIRLAYYEDETTAQCNWQFPQAHYLESWGDVRTRQGSLAAVQPLIEPLFGGFTELEFLALLGGLEVSNPYEIVRETFKSVIQEEDVFENSWRSFLHNGFHEKAVAAAIESPTFNWRNASRELNGLPATEDALSEENLQVIFKRDYSVDDGRYVNNGWLQECPDPITKLTWDNAVLVSPGTAKQLKVENRDVVKIDVGDHSVTGPIWIQPGQVANTLICTLGYGHSQTGRVGTGSGYNAYSIRTSDAPWHVSGVKVTPTGRKYQLACTQDHSAMEGRAIIREANVEQYHEHPDFAGMMGIEAHAPNAGRMYDSKYRSYARVGNETEAEKKRDEALDPGSIHQWGMTIDLNSCVGCNSCVVACQSENNIPIVGKDQVDRGREMHWIRLDRYYAGDEEDPQVVIQPMACQHCEKAPCESVCPVNATAHDDEGLNVMVYNRCIGTRYCSNNCPYKVRRFNYFDYQQRPLDKLYLGPLAKKGTPELIKILMNPDVTVRMRGVMEKCTYCAQRIESAKIDQLKKAKDSGDIEVPDGTITPACAQSCPADAIVFGNIADPESEVTKLKNNSRNYEVLGYLDNKARTTYLAKLRNPNKKMPDYVDRPRTFEEYSARNGNPFESHHGEESNSEHETEAHAGEQEDGGVH